MYFDNKGLRALIIVCISCLSPFSSDAWEEKRQLYQFFCRNQGKKIFNVEYLMDHLSIQHTGLLIKELVEYAKSQDAKIIDFLLVSEFFSRLDHQSFLHSWFSDDVQSQSQGIAKLLVAHTLSPCVVTSRVDRDSDVYDLHYDNGQTKFAIKNVFAPFGELIVGERVFVHLATICNTQHSLPYWQNILNHQAQSQIFNRVAAKVQTLDYRTMLRQDSRAKTRQRFIELEKAYGRI